MISLPQHFKSYLTFKIGTLLRSKNIIKPGASALFLQSKRGLANLYEGRERTEENIFVKNEEKVRLNKLKHEIEQRLLRQDEIEIKRILNAMDEMLSDEAIQKLAEWKEICLKNELKGTYYKRSINENLKIDSPQKENK